MLNTTDNVEEDTLTGPYILKVAREGEHLATLSGRLSQVPAGLNATELGFVDNLARVFRMSIDEPGQIHLQFRPGKG